MSEAAAGELGPAAITLHRRIEWIDTDAAGIYHWTTVFRLAESAEAALHTALGIAGITFGFTPRVAVQFEFTRTLRFNDPVVVRFAVAAVGRSSIRYAISVDGPDGVAAHGHITACFVGAGTGRPQPWPEEVRRFLAHGGPLGGESIVGLP